MGNNYMRAKKGFTLIEMLIVVAIISVLRLQPYLFSSSALNKSAKVSVWQIAGRFKAPFMPTIITGTHDTLEESFNSIYHGEGEDRYVCPGGGTFTWEGTDTSGHVICSVHGDSAIRRRKRRHLRRTAGGGR
jgi:prepilin-type N-terminal cleavage/methylation domain-containing protein